MVLEGACDQSPVELHERDCGGPPDSCLLLHCFSGVQQSRSTHTNRSAGPYGRPQSPETTMTTLASSPLAVHVDDKPNTIEHQELSALPDIKSHDVSPTLTSRYANLSLRATLSMFPMATTYALMAAFNAANDGYCYSIPGA